MRLYHSLFLLLFFSGIHAQKEYKYKRIYGVEDLEKQPSKPDYAKLEHWIAHPDKEDMADKVPGKGELLEYQADALVDAFFIYPTIYSKKQKPENPWLADVNDEELNEDIAESTIMNQASVFNESAKVYAPLYRQMHMAGFYDDPEIKARALDIAYEDVKKAFEYYLKNWNNDRPIIIASHSQGTIHAGRLLKEFFEDKPLQEKLVAAYIIGMPVSKSEFNRIKPCGDATATGCWVTWNTYLNGYYPKEFEKSYKNALSVNPLSWSTDEEHVSWGENRGGVLWKFKKIIPEVCDAQNHKGLLWIEKPRFFGNLLFNWKRFHVADYNLFYCNIRTNVGERVEAYLEMN